jgi:hypothetical protein
VVPAPKQRQNAIPKRAIWPWVVERRIAHSEIATRMSAPTAMRMRNVSTMVNTGHANGVPVLVVRGTARDRGRQRARCWCAYHPPFDGGVPTGGTFAVTIGLRLIARMG